jgi:heme/copper-type cytochrome/quinol oxidase subunit 1
VRRSAHVAAVVTFLSLAAPRVALAGMPVPYTLRELAILRLEAISFFLATLLVCGVIVRWVWNGLRPETSRLPRLTYGKALGVVVLWGLLFSVVLTMISGARELMTPGAWERHGATYRLVPPDGAK